MRPVDRRLRIFPARTYRETEHRAQRGLSQIGERHVRPLLILVDRIVKVRTAHESPVVRQVSSRSCVPLDDLPTRSLVYSSDRRHRRFTESANRRWRSRERGIGLFNDNRRRINVESKLPFNSPH